MKQKNKKNLTKISTGFKMSSKVQSHANDPFFVKKAKESKEFLDKHGFPDPSLYKK